MSEAIRKAHLGVKDGPHSKAWNKKISKSLMGHPVSKKVRDRLYKGKEAGYSAFHKRVQAKRGNPQSCEMCKTSIRRRYEWANLTGKYHDIKDYKRMCKPCHMNYDFERKNGKKT